MKRVGITGGIGCGKSTVVSVFRSLGVPCFVADQAAAAYYDDPEFKASLRGLLGDAVFMADGSVDKRGVASIVFADGDMLARLNQLVHPQVLDDFNQFCIDHAQHDYVLFESAILYDHGFDLMMDCVVCVYLDLEERLRRLVLRDGVGERQIMARIANQLPADEVMMRADYVVLNYEGNPRRRQVEYIDKQLRK